jgi:hypothetical protein
LILCPSRPEPMSVLRVRADCGGRLFTAKLGVVLFDHLLANGAGQVMPPHAGRMEDNNNSAKHANALSAHERSVDVAAILPVARGTCAAVSTFNGSSARLRQAANWISAQYYDRFGCLPVLGRRSDADRRSTPDRRSPMRLFSSPLRVSTPLRRSFPERRSDPLRLSSTLMGLLLSDLLRQQNRE